MKPREFNLMEDGNPNAAGVFGAVVWPQYDLVNDTIFSFDTTGSPFTTVSHYRQQALCLSPAAVERDHSWQPLGSL